MSTGIKLTIILILLVVPNFALADNHECPEGFECLQNPLSGKTIHIDRPGDLVVKAFQGFASIMAAFTIAFTVFSGFKLIIASNEESIKEARQAIAWSVGGFVVSILAFTIISGTAKFLGYDPGLVDIEKDVIVNPIAIPGGPGPSGDFISVMNFVMVNFLGIVGFATTLVIIYYGYRYVTAAGNEEAVTQAKSGLKWALLGLVVVLLAFTIIAAVRQYLVFGLQK